MLTKTPLIILTPAPLHQAAWSALLSDQPALGPIVTASSANDLAEHSDTERAAVLIDIPYPDRDLIAQLPAAMPAAGQLNMVDEYDVPQMVSLLQAGAAGFLRRDATVTQLVQALIAVGRGEIVVPPQLATRVLTALARRGQAASTPVAALTDREEDVLHLLAQGRTNKEIAQTLFLSVRTVEAHLRNLYNKIDVTSRTEAVLWAIRRGVV